MFAVIKTGGKQYRVAPEDSFTIERVPGEAGDLVTFKEVLMVGSTIGAPFVEGASVTAEIVEQTRGKKVISFKKRRRQNSKRSRGHRQDLTLIRVSEILTDGKAPSKKARRQGDPPAKAEARSGRCIRGSGRRWRAAVHRSGRPEGQADEPQGRRPGRREAAERAGHHHLRPDRRAQRRGRGEDRRQHAVQRRPDRRLARAGPRTGQGLRAGPYSR